MQYLKKIPLLAGLIAGVVAVPHVGATITLDRTRVIFPGGKSTMSLNIHNDDSRLPFLAQAWLEDTQGHKITSPLVIVPPLQRLEPGESGQLEVKALPSIAGLPQDRESLFYYNLREIPPKSNKANMLQLALQTRIKFFYRPKAIQQTRQQMQTPWQDKLTLSREGQGMVVHNPTPYYITIVAAGNSAQIKPKNGFTPLMIEPFGQTSLNSQGAELGNAPVLTYVNDYGISKAATFSCAGTECRVVHDESLKG